MHDHHRRSWFVFFFLLIVYAALAILTFVLGFADEMAAAVPSSAPLPEVPRWVLGAANAGMILIIYGSLGSLGLALALRLGLPGILREGATRRELFTIPLLLGVVIGVSFIAIDSLFSTASGWDGFSHPEFPASIIASASAGIGEEVMFRLFMLSAWAALLNVVLERWGQRRLALWIANSLAALAFSAAHIPAVMLILGVTTPGQIPFLVLIELIALNSLLGLVAGERFLKTGLIAASGVHFWADIIWHVLYPLLLR